MHYYSFVSLQAKLPPCLLDALLSGPPTLRRLEVDFGFLGVDDAAFAGRFVFAEALGIPPGRLLEELDVLGEDTSSAAKMAE